MVCEIGEFVSITKNGVTFNKGVVKKLDCPQYVLLLINTQTKQIAIQVCSKEVDRAVAFFNDEKKKNAFSVRWNGRDLINTITLYLLDNFEYDHASVENYEYDRSEVSAYNDEPISTFIAGKKGVCINYAATFTGLANRAGIDTFQLFNQDHTWNAIKTSDGYKGYDLSYLEYGSIVRIEDVNTFVMIKDTTAQDLIRQGKSKHLHFYEFNIDEIVSDNHIADYTPQEILDNVLNIGYINDDSLVRVIEKNQIKLYKMDIFIRSQLILSILTAIMLEISRRNYEKKIKENQEERAFHM